MTIRPTKKWQRAVIVVASTGRGVAKRPILNLSQQDEAWLIDQGFADAVDSPVIGSDREPDKASESQADQASATTASSGEKKAKTSSRKTRSRKAKSGT